MMVLKLTQVYLQWNIHLYKVKYREQGQTNIAFFETKASAGKELKRLYFLKEKSFKRSHHV